MITTLQDYILDPAAFLRYASASPKHMDSETANRLLKPILKVLQLRHIIGSEMEVLNGEKISIGANVQSHHRQAGHE